MDRTACAGAVVVLMAHRADRAKLCGRLDRSASKPPRISAIGKVRCIAAWQRLGLRSSGVVRGFPFAAPARVRFVRRLC